jgi:hypothetical protein
MVFWPVNPVLSVTVKVGEKLPGSVGVPDIVPVLLTTSPFGRLPPVSVQLYGAVPPVAARVLVVYASFRAPSGREEVVIEGLDAAGVEEPPPPPPHPIIPRNAKTRSATMDFLLITLSSSGNSNEISHILL